MTHQVNYYLTLAAPGLYIIQTPSNPTARSLETAWWVAGAHQAPSSSSTPAATPLVAHDPEPLASTPAPLALAHALAPTPGPTLLYSVLSPAPPAPPRAPTDRMSPTIPPGPHMLVAPIPTHFSAAPAFLAGSLQPSAAARESPMHVAGGSPVICAAVPPPRTPPPSPPQQFTPLTPAPRARVHRQQRSSPPPIPPPTPPYILPPMSPFGGARSVGLDCEDGQVAQ
ncbi:hypothetical protein FA95DRAFT_1611826 [Auriscalpium vulgare]|uniref:Uncharacterized protein n=1 Tax=Auriscalpium vulgare TaxID=40419 RepID=A0ACB8R8R3_9AGAM|nr:hypothetical protein FA95DRAFT_1611826 [Auriscalpium vulgare]